MASLCCLGLEKNDAHWVKSKLEEWKMFVGYYLERRGRRPPRGLALSLCMILVMLLLHELKLFQLSSKINTRSTITGIHTLVTILAGGRPWLDGWDV